MLKRAAFKAVTFPTLHLTKCLTCQLNSTVVIVKQTRQEKGQVLQSGQCFIHVFYNMFLSTYMQKILACQTLFIMVHDF